MPSVITAIDGFVRAHPDGDVDFFVVPPRHPSQLHGEIADARTIVFTSKADCLDRVRTIGRLEQPIATVARRGLPVPEDVTTLAAGCDNRIFIGDCDPPDLLAFAWLREQVQITWHGVSDRFLAAHGNLETTWIQIGLGPREQRAVAMLDQLCPDYCELVGEYCSSLLQRGFKIELEGAVCSK